MPFDPHWERITCRKESVTRRHTVARKVNVYLLHHLGELLGHMQNGRSESHQQHGREDQKEDGENQLGGDFSGGFLRLLRDA